MKMAFRRRQWQTASFRGDAANYKNIKILGEGNFGAVFLARDKIYERFVAIKQIGLNQQDVEATDNEIQGGNVQMNQLIAGCKGIRYRRISATHGSV